MKQIFICSGEASGDVHAAHLIQALNLTEPRLEFVGMGGDHMRAAGAKVLVDFKRLALIGIIEPLFHLPEIIKTLRYIKKELRERRPDLLILIDFPGFNLRIAKYARKIGLKTLYYISPQVWAWHQSRVKLIRRVVDHMAVIFPFEVDFYRDKGVPVSFVGHPLINKVKPSLSPTEIYEKFQLNPQAKIIALVAGSRINEINYIFPTILNAAKLLKARFPDCQFVLPLASNLSEDLLKPFLADIDIPVKIIKNALYDLISVSDAAIAVSGTVTLEIALLRKPMIIIYKTNQLTYLIGRLLVKVKSMGICNLIAGTNIVPELIQHQANEKNISQAIIDFLTDKAYYETTEQKLTEVKESLSNIKCEITLTQLVTNMLAETP